MVHDTHMRRRSDGWCFW